MDRKLNPNSSFVSEMSKYIPQRANALKTEDRPKRSASPEPVDTAYRKVCKVKDAVVNDCVNRVVNSIPSDVKNGCKVCFQYLKKADDASFNVVSTVVDVTLGNVVRGLDWLDKSAEMSGAGVRRYLRDGLGIDQATAQNIGDGLEIGMKMLISIVPAKSMNLASNASKRLVKLTPAGGPSNGFKFKFYDENVVYKELKAVPASKPSSGFKVHKKIKQAGPATEFTSKVFYREVEWTAPNGTRQTYRVTQRNDIDWKMVRTSGVLKARGMTNLEAASKGYAPILNNGETVQLHHIRQQGKGGLVEVSEGVHKKYTHNEFGGQKKNPFDPVDRSAFDLERPQYWKARAMEILNEN